MLDSTAAPRDRIRASALALLANAWVSNKPSTAVGHSWASKDTTNQKILTHPAKSKLIENPKKTTFAIDFKSPLP